MDSEDVDCNAVVKEIYYFLDGELTAEKRNKIEHHLNGCSPCLEAFDFEAELRSVIAKKCRDEVPEGLRDRIAQRIYADDPSFPLPGRGSAGEAGGPLGGLPRL